MNRFTANVYRSELYNSIATIRPSNSARMIKLDVWGSVIVPFLFVSLLNLMRLVFVN